MKYLNLLIALLVTTVGFAQRHNTYFLKNDGRRVTNKDSADFIRIVSEPDSGAVNFKVLEYYKDNQIKLRGESSNVDPLTFEGSVISYFTNGKRLAIEQFDHGEKKHSYTYYPNGKPQAVRDYPEALAGTNSYKNFLLMIYNDTTGKAIITDGNGIYAGFDIEMKDRYCEGKIVNGKKEGVWTGNYQADKITFVEEYHNGDLVTGTCTTAKNKKYTYHTEVELLNVGNPDGPTLELVRSSNVIPKLAPILMTEIRTEVTTRIVSVPAGTSPSLSRTNMLNSNANIGSTPNIYNLQAHGTVVLSFVIDKNGRLMHMQVRKSLNEDLDEFALKTAENSIRRKANNQPAILMGKPIDSYYTVSATF